MGNNFEQRDNSAFIFKNDDRRNDRQPTHRGQAKVDGNEYWLSCWVKEGKRGKFFSCSFTPKDENGRQTPNTGQGSGPGPAGRFDDFDDDIPF